MKTLRDFNKQEIRRGPYIDSKTGKPIRVYDVGDDKLYFADPYETFNEDQKPSILTREGASRLIRLTSPEGLKKLLDATQYVDDLRAPKFDFLPRNNAPFRSRSSRDVARNKEGISRSGYGRDGHMVIGPYFGPFKKSPKKS